MGSAYERMGVKKKSGRERTEEILKEIEKMIQGRKEYGKREMLRQRKQTNKQNTTKH